MLFVRNLANSVTEEILEKAFGQFGKLERVKKLKDYAFIHFDERDGAVKVSAFEQHLIWLEKLFLMVITVVLSTWMFAGAGRNERQRFRGRAH